MAIVTVSLPRRAYLTSDELVPGLLYEMNGKEIVIATSQSVKAKYATAVVALRTGRTFICQHFTNSEYRQVKSVIKVTGYAV